MRTSRIKEALCRVQGTTALGTAKLAHYYNGQMLLSQGPGQHG